jgi:hypothetical protein
VRLGLDSFLFVVLQVTLWTFVVISWMRVITTPTPTKEVRHWLARASLACASCTLLLTTAMTVYSWFIQKRPYDRLEGKYLFYTLAISLLGVLLGIAGKSRPRLVGLVTSVFTFLIALADGITT